MPRRTACLPFPVAPTVLALLFAIACDDQPLPTGIPTARSPLYTIADASHDYKPGFYWLPPMAKQPAYTGTFDAALLPTVEICELAADASCPVLATYTTTTGPGGELVRLDVDEQHFQVNWHTNEFDLSTTNPYRVSVRAGIYETLLGYADVRPVSNGSGLKNVDTDEYIGLVDGRTLPIKFRIETGIVGNVEVQPVEATAEPGATQQFIAILRDLHGNLMTADVSWASSDENVATVDQTGLATAVGDGVTTITATSERITGSATLAVEAGGIVALSAGGHHTCVLSGGRAYCWGRGHLGQLGNGATIDRSTPVAVSDGGDFIAIESGTFHTCAITATGAVFCWGWDSLGQLGDGSLINSTCLVTEPCSLTPVAVSGTQTFASISAGFWHSCGITPEGRAYCWGYNGPEGRLGNGSQMLSRTPQPVSGDLTFASISAGQNHTCGVTTAGQGYCWGAGTGGILGNGSTANRMTPAPVSGDLAFASIQTGNSHTCGLTTDGRAYCWGVGSGGKLGNGGTATRLTPVAVSGDLVFASITLGLNHTCGLTTGGQGYCWGAGSQGQLGGTPPGGSRLTPGPVSGGLTFVSIAVGQSHTCAVTTSEETYCWGIGSFGQLGNGSTPFAQLAPTPVAEFP